MIEVVGVARSNVHSRAVRLASAGVVLVLLLLAISIVWLVRLAHTHQVMVVDEAVETRLAQSLELLADAETGQRGFLLTQDVEYLAPYERALVALPERMREISGIVRDDPAQQSRLSRLDDLVTVKLAELRETVDLEKAGEHERAMSNVRTGRGNRTMEAIRAVAGKMLDAEDDLIAQRNASARSLALFDLIVTAVAGAFLVALGLLQYAAGCLLERRMADARMADIERFAGRVAHDVRSPLASVSHAVSLAQRQPDDPRTAPALEVAEKTLYRVGELVDALLVFALAGASPAEGAKADLQAVVGDAVQTLRTEAQEHGVELATEPLPATTVACSPGALTSMITELIQNAIAYIGQRDVKRVSIAATTDGASTRLEVRDTGPGIPRKQWGTIFDPHLRAPGEVPAGWGLGLATVRRLAVAHGGRVGIAANAPAGTVVWIELPNEAQSQPGVADVTRAARWSRRRWRGLIGRESHG